MDDVCRVHIVDGTEQLVEDELDHLFSEWDLLGVDQPLKCVVHILHAEIYLVVGLDFLVLYLHHVLQPNNILVL